MKIQYKASSIIFTIGIITLFVISTVYYIYSRRVSTQEGLQKLEILSQETAQHIQTHLKEQSITTVTLSSSPVIKQALIQSNKEFALLSDDARKQKIDGLNRKWIETDDTNDPFIQAHLTNSVSDYLRRLQELFPYKYGEIFLTNRFGVMIATTGKLTTLSHAHKYWWDASYDGGKGKIFFDDRGFDTSVKGYVLGVVVPIREKNEIIGILKCNINISGSLRHLIEAFVDKKTGTAKIVRSGGVIVVEPGKAPLSTLISAQVVKELSRDEIRSLIIHENSAEQLVAIAPIMVTMGSKKIGFGGSYESIDHIKGNSGEGWHVVIFRDKKELSIVTTRATRMFIVTGIIFLVVISTIALLLGRKFAAPLEKLVQVTKNIGEGHLDSRIVISSKDEIGILAESFNAMSQNLQREKKERKQIGLQLHNIEWLLEKTVAPNVDRSQYMPPYGDLVPLNTKRVLLNAVGQEMLINIVGDFLDLLESSSAVYETNGDYALGIFSSGWCKFLDNASRNLCATDDNQEALESGLWLCHESCWTEASKIAIETGQPTDIECQGGLHLYALPIRSGEEIVGAINVGYGNPPTDREKLQEISGKYDIPFAELLEKAETYEERPKYMIEIAKKRLHSAARLIGEIVERKRVEEKLWRSQNELELRVEERTTELKNLEKRLSQAQKMEAIGTLAGGIAHDFNNILSPILGYADMALENLPPGTQTASDIEEVIKAGNRAKDLVKQILAFSRQVEHEKQPIKVQLVVKEALKLLRASIPTTIEVKQNIDPECGAILSDPTQIHQIIMNLCTNAYHAMRETGGVLGVKLNQVEFGPGDLTSKMDLMAGQHVQLEVSDTGHGMNQIILERIFDPYYTTKAKGEGTGLGLSVVHGIVKSLHGDISVYSEPGMGTTFHVYFPMVETEAGKRVEVKIAEQLPSGDEHVLVVDDEEVIVNMVQQMLNSLGYQVSCFTSCEEALKAFQTAPDSFDLIITDMTMPKITGMQLTREILAVRPDIPVMLCTGFSELINEEKAEKAGICRYLMKPLLKKDLAHAVREVLDEKS